MSTRLLLRIVKYDVTNMIDWLINWIFVTVARVAQWVRSLDLTAHTSLPPIRRGFAPSCVNCKKGALGMILQIWLIDWLIGF
jgi:hypothetical protein